MASRQQIHCAQSSSRLTAALQTLASERALARIFQKDPSVWTDNTEAHPSILNRLGWLTIPGVMAKRTGELNEFARSIRAAGFTHAVLLGMGGSSLFAEVLCRIFGRTGEGLQLYVLDSTDPAAVRAVTQQAPAAKTLALVSSKSGTTSEVSALFKHFFEYFKQADGKPGSHCVAITDAGTPLEAQAMSNYFHRSFVLDQALGRDVGGRFSALTYFGLVPAVLMGLNVNRMLNAGLGMLQACGVDAPPEKNAALQLGALIGAMSESGRNKLTFLCPPSLTTFGIWAEQLVAESTGKLGKGMLPVVGERLWDVAGYGQDRVFVELQRAEAIDAAVRSQAEAAAKAGHPVVQITWSDAYDVAEEAVKWCLATAVAGAVLRVNPFDEPNVWETKDQTKVILSDYNRDRRLAQETPSVADGDVSVFDPFSVGAGSVEDRLRAFTAQAKTGDFVAVLSFLPQIPETDAVLERIRRALGMGGRRAVVVQIGPRYLHSTGQLHKGGFNGGLFLMLTGDDAQDLEIPGEVFSFSVLKRAQALGDFQALRKKGRRLMRIHLSGSYPSAAQKLVKLVEACAGSEKPSPARR